MPRLWQWSRISLKSVAVFKERCSGKLVEPAGNKIQADPSPPPSTPCNDTSAELAITAHSFTVCKRRQELHRKKNRLFKRLQKKSTFSVSSIINLWCSKSPGVILWWSDGGFFSVPLSPPPASPTSTSHIPLKLLRPPPETGRELAPFNQMWDAWMTLKGCDLPLKTPKWHGAATLSGLFLCYCRRVCFSLMDWTSEQTVCMNGIKLHWSW